MNTEPNPDFDYQAYMRSLPPRGREGDQDPIRIHRGPRARQGRREAAKKRLSRKDITTVAQFHAWLEELDAGKRPFLYRGQSDSHQPVNCSAVRRLTGFATEPIENQLTDHLLVGYLEYLIGKARRRGFMPSNLGESAADLEDLELLALLQHQGAATGLMDFTRRPLAALWFACNESNDRDGAVFLLPHAEVEEIKKRDALKEKIQFFYGKNKLWSWEPPVLGSRIVAQSSVFVFGISAIPLARMERLTIPAVKKRNILGELETVYGINEEELFPDFSGYAVANSSKKTFDVNRAIEYWKEQIDSASDRKRAWAHLMCGAAYSAVQNHSQAVEHYDEAIRIDPQQAVAYTYRGNVKNTLRHHLKAIADYDEALRIDPRYAPAYNNRGHAKAELGRHEEAIADYDEALRIDPQYVNARNNREIAKEKLRQASPAE